MRMRADDWHPLAEPLIKRIDKLYGKHSRDVEQLDEINEALAEVMGFIRGLIIDDEMSAAMQIEDAIDDLMEDESIPAYDRSFLLSLIDNAVDRAATQLHMVHGEAWGGPLDEEAGLAKGP